MDKKLLLSIDGENKVYADLGDVLHDRERPEIESDICRRTMNSVLKDLKSGQVWIQFETSRLNSNCYPYLACAEGWQDLSTKMIKRIFNEVDLVRKDHLVSTTNHGRTILVVKKWTWRINECS